MRPCEAPTRFVIKKWDGLRLSVSGIKGRISDSQISTSDTGWHIYVVFTFTIGITYFSPPMILHIYFTYK
jgi:hypothetical protein